ncbi:hypothetical protein UWK_00852 [Desulfocapsa sulfexigens DSM 10523]|uniref:Uncharacterized protein n=1 Tax=Desulfocapsa sulfexigens (strain DSM 10523 / SB164P1) TaxID=1167006 RepID=M1PLU9_DESSD|nr:hypothetical protein [Desulfocapsa sulfexigens]AGF77426.1 hypothetical protein UWK_00852 [Desulfocapsa sulfexigens DSM 10523]
MNKLKKFFNTTPKDLNMQNTTINEIAHLMSSAEPNIHRLPTNFAKKVSIICAEMCDEENASDSPPGFQTEKKL